MYHISVANGPKVANKTRYQINAKTQPFDALVGYINYSYILMETLEVREKSQNI